MRNNILMSVVFPLPVKLHELYLLSGRILTNQYNNNNNT